MKPSRPPRRASSDHSSRRASSSCELALDVLAVAEVGHGQPLGPPRPDRRDRLVPGLDVDVRRRRGRDRHRRRGIRTPPDVADERRAVVQIGDVMRGVTGRVGDLEAVVEQPLAAAEQCDVVLGHRHHLAPQALHVVPVEPRGAVHQPRGVDQVARAALVDVDLAAPASAAPASRSRRRDRGGCGSAAARAGRSSPSASSSVGRHEPGPGIDQHVAHLPAPDHALATEVHEVDHAHGGSAARRWPSEVGDWRPARRRDPIASAARPGADGSRRPDSASARARHATVLDLVDAGGSGSLLRGAAPARLRRRLGLLLLLVGSLGGACSSAAAGVELAPRGSGLRRPPRRAPLVLGRLGVLDRSAAARPRRRGRRRRGRAPRPREALGRGLGQRQQLPARSRRRRRSAGARPRSGRCRHPGP